MKHSLCEFCCMKIGLRGDSMSWCRYILTYFRTYAQVARIRFVFLQIFYVNSKIVDQIDNRFLHSHMHTPCLQSTSWKKKFWRLKCISIDVEHRMERKSFFSRSVFKCEALLRLAFSARTRARAYVRAHERQLYSNFKTVRSVQLNATIKKNLLLAQFFL